MVQDGTHNQDKSVSNPQDNSLSVDQKANGKKPSPLRFLLVFGGLVIGYYALYATDFYYHYLYTPIVKLDAFLGSKILWLLGQNTHSEGISITNSQFSVSVSIGCDGLEAMALFAIAIVAYPMTTRIKLIGLGWGLLFLWGLNLLRIITLFLTGVYWPSAFDFMHLEFWQVVFFLLAIVAWLRWVKWGKRETARPSGSL